MIERTTNANFVLYTKYPVSFLFLVLGYGIVRFMNVVPDLVDRFKRSAGVSIRPIVLEPRALDHEEKEGSGLLKIFGCVKAVP